MALGCATMNDSLGGATEEQPGHDIRRAREALGLSQPEVAKLAGLGPRTVRRVEAGQGEPEARTIAALRRVLGLPVDGAPPDPLVVLRSVSTVDFITESTRRFLEADSRIAELTRKLEAAEAALQAANDGADDGGQRRVQVGHLPPEISDKQGILRGPATHDQRAGSNE